MSEPEHPMNSVWLATAAELEEGVPETVTIPKAEMIRFCQSMFFFGINSASLGLLTLEKMMGEDDPKELLRLNYMLHTGKWVKKNQVGSLEQLLATLRAHEAKANG